MQNDNEKKIDYKLYYLIAQAIMCIFIIILIFVLRFFKIVDNEKMGNWYKENFGQQTKVETVTDEEDEQSDLSFSYDENINAVNTSLDLTKTQNLLKTNTSLNSLIWPVNDGKITSDFGLRSDPFTEKATYHKGLDIAVNTGTPVMAAASGKVIRAGYEKGGYGNFAVIEHSSGFMTLYAHCSKVTVKAGDSVKAGQNIALSGSSGRSTGPHLHFEVRLHGTLLNPLWILPSNDAI